MTCSRVSNQLSAYIDRELTGAEMLHLRRHLEDCTDCRAEYDALCGMKMLLGRLAAPEPGADLAARTLRRWEQQQTLEAVAPAAGRVLAAPRVRDWLADLGTQLAGRFPRPPAGAWRAGFGTMAAVLVAGLILTTVFLNRPRHADALIATSPLSVLEGQDPLSHEAGREWHSLSPPRYRLSEFPGVSGRPPLNWMPVSYPGEVIPGFR